MIVPMSAGNGRDQLVNGRDQPPNGASAANASPEFGASPASGATAAPGGSSRLGDPDPGGERAQEGHDVDRWLARWREGLGGGDPEGRLPENEARLVLEALFDELRRGRSENLDRAGRAWGRASASVVDAVEQLTPLRDALAGSGVGALLRAQCALDQVAAAASREILRRASEESGPGEEWGWDEPEEPRVSFLRLVGRRRDGSGSPPPAARSRQTRPGG